MRIQHFNYIAIVNPVQCLIFLNVFTSINLNFLYIYKKTKKNSIEREKNRLDVLPNFYYGLYAATTNGQTILSPSLEKI